MPRTLLMIALVLSAAPALAQQFPAAPVRSPGQPVRSFSLTNQSGQVIVSAQAKMSDGKQRVLTYAPIQRNQAREIVVPRQECLDSMAVHLNDGQTLRAVHMNDCNGTKIIVGPTGIRIASNANPLRQ
ncbi:MAG TPA: hypothetical protein VME47_04350 [Acetobacteraceae bacterium]|nr:hypothetical protein [Acetobacteraceae bacterium]